MENKENAIKDYLEMIKKESWTFQKLTQEEINRLMLSFQWAEIHKMICGNYEQRWKILQALYTTFLNALGYNGLGWRE